MKKITFAFSFTILMLLNACSKDEDNGDSGGNNGGNSGGGNTTVDCGPVAKAFAADVKPIITASCTGSTCHASGSGNGPGALLTYDQINAAKVNIKSAVSSGLMPKEGKLTTAQKNTIICWIEAGAPNN
ncbi:MAG: hypothetical protein IPK94_04430 [Saprospiraceae bacterium]|nr:hypothetical protein [Saprospiraceae bacterium]MBK7436609.1 hypothetical protein [Saprospiraceae bacterium]MBK8279421.1 hypothetical protein [Saprospiraceae bacterium]MBL0113597.1 hypothetical protein [Saprospiraceae bacterium]MBP8943934.1 hypothetical protein [Saprospiraceae bacterium]